MRTLSLKLIPGNGVRIEVMTDAVLAALDHHLLT